MDFPPYKYKDDIFKTLEGIFETYKETLKDSPNLVKKLDNFIESSEKFEEDLTEFIHTFYDNDLDGFTEIKSMYDLKDIHKELIKQKEYLKRLQKAISKQLKEAEECDEIITEEFPHLLI